MTKDEALAFDLALEALETLMNGSGFAPAENIEKARKAITAIKQARSAPVQEPAPVQVDAWPCVIAEADFEQNTITLEMQCSDYKVGAGQHWLHTTTPAAQRPWFGLSDEEYSDLYFSVGYAENVALWKSIEAKLKEKNT